MLVYSYYFCTSKRICCIACEPQNVRCLRSAEWTRGQRGDVEQSIGRRRELTVVHKPCTCCSYNMIPAVVSVGSSNRGNSSAIRQQNFDEQFCCFICAQIQIAFVLSVVSWLLSFLRLERGKLTKRNGDTQLKSTRRTQPAGLLGQRLVRFISVLQYIPRSSTARA